LAEALALPVVAQLTHLHLAGGRCHDPAVARALAGATHLKRLTSLWLEQVGIDDEGLALLARSPQLRSLTELHLEANHIGPAGIRALTGSRCLAGLRRLYLGYNINERSAGFGAEGARLLACWPRLKQLTALDLGANNLGDPGVVALAGSPHLPRPDTL